MGTQLTSEALLASVDQLLAQKDRYAAVEFLNTQDPSLAAEVYKKLQLDLYWKRRDLPLTVAISQAGIQHCLTAAGREDQTESARALRGSAKQLAFNLASFTWPGWDEKGMAIGPSDLAVGLDAARLNLRLAEELDRPPKAKANAWWMLGAQQLAVTDYPGASRSFVEAKAFALRAGERVLERAMEGYGLMAQAIAEPGNAAIREQFDTVVASLKNDASEDSGGYAEQMAVAIRVFQG